MKKYLSFNMFVLGWISSAALLYILEGEYEVAIFNLILIIINLILRFRFLNKTKEVE